MAQKDEGNYQVLSTKISSWAYAQIMKILSKKGINKYQLLQNMCEVILRFMSDKHNRTPEMEQAMETFENMEGWKDNFNLCDPNTKPEISEATYYLSDFTKDKAKKGVRVVHVERPMMDKWTQTFNVQQILERFMCLTFPTLYKRLRFIAVCRECNSILELLIDIVGELEREEEKRELSQPFEDADRGDFGQHVHTDRNRKRPYEASQETLFKDELI